MNQQRHHRIGIAACNLGLFSGIHLNPPIMHLIVRHTHPFKVLPCTDVLKVATHRFTVEEGDWGFTRFAELRKLFSKSDEHERPLVEEEKANITAYVRVYKDPTGVLWHNFIKYV